MGDSNERKKQVVARMQKHDFRSDCSDDAEKAGLHNDNNNNKTMTLKTCSTCTVPTSR